MRTLLFFASFLAFSLVQISLPVTAAPGGDDAKISDPIVQSWQVDHPVATGVFSALSFGLWPKLFGDDAVHEPGAYSMNAGYGETAFDYVRNAAKPIFINTRRIVWSALLVLMAVLAFRSILNRRKAS